MRYAHARPRERCTRCNDLAARVVGTQPLCIAHFDAITTHCRRAAHSRMLTPPELTPAGFAAWARLLEHGINTNIITPDEARHAWQQAKEFAA